MPLDFNPHMAKASDVLTKHYRGMIKKIEHTYSSSSTFNPDSLSDSPGVELSHLSHWWAGLDPGQSWLQLLLHIEMVEGK